MFLSCASGQAKVSALIWRIRHSQMQFLPNISRSLMIIVADSDYQDLTKCHHRDWGRKKKKNMDEDQIQYLRTWNAARLCGVWRWKLRQDNRWVVFRLVNNTLHLDEDELLSWRNLKKELGWKKSDRQINAPHPPKKSSLVQMRVHFNNYCSSFLWFA